MQLVPALARLFFAFALVFAAVPAFTPQRSLSVLVHAHLSTTKSALAATTGSDTEGAGTVVFETSFSHVKQALSTLLKFWLMGGCGDAEGWIAETKYGGFASTIIITHIILFALSIIM